MLNNSKTKLADIGRYLTSFLILGTASVLLVLMTLSRTPPEKSDNSILKQIVEVFYAEQFDGQLEIDVSGMVEPHREIEMASQVSGEILHKSLECRAGNYVIADTVLIRIDPKNYELACKRLEAEKAQAEANILELDQELENLQQSVDLVKREFELQKLEYARKEKAGSALSLSERDQALRTLNTAERALTELKNNRRLTETRRTRLLTGIDLANVKLEEARVNEARCEIRAPFNGVIVEDSVEQGDYVTAGKTVIILEDTSKADVTCNLRFEQVQKIVKYQIPDSRFTRDPLSAYQLPPTPVVVTRKRFDGKLVRWSGTLSRFDGIGVDSQTKMIPCRIVVDDPISVELGQPKALVRGMFVNVKITLDVFAEEDQSLLIIPARAIHPGNRIWSAVDGKLREHYVEVLDRKNSDDPDRDKRMVVVRIGRDELVAGMPIVISALAQPEPGSEVILEDNDDSSENSEVDRRKGPVPATSTSTSIDDGSEPASVRTKEGVIRS